MPSFYATHTRSDQTTKTESVTSLWSDSGRYFSGTYSPEGVQAIEEGAKRPLAGRVSTKVYKPRSIHRYLFIGEHFDTYLSGTILDVGSRDNTIRTKLGKNAELVDKNNPELESFDWERAPLPYNDRAFETVVCLDTLEHIDRFHDALTDLLRVSDKYVIISLPNCWRKMLKYMVVKGAGSRPSYGLPPEKPLDRHRWFFNTEDIVSFFDYQGVVNTHPYIVRDVRFHLPAEAWWQPYVYPVVMRLLPRRFFLNWFVNTVFVVLEKRA